MQKLIIAILKAALLPAAIMIVSKLFGLIIGNSMFGLNMYISNDIQGLYTVQLFFTNAQETLIANSFSNFVMMMGLLLGFTIFFIRYKLYQVSADSPKTLVRLVRLNLLDWITSNKGGVVSTTIWAIFLWSACIITLVQTLSNGAMLWVAIIASFVLVITFWGMINIFENDLKRHLPEEKFMY